LRKADILLDRLGPAFFSRTPTSLLLAQSSIWSSLIRCVFLLCNNSFANRKLFFLQETTLFSSRPPSRECEAPRSAPRPEQGRRSPLFSVGAAGSFRHPSMSHFLWADPPFSTQTRYPRMKHASFFVGRPSLFPSFIDEVFFL